MKTGGFSGRRSALWKRREADEVGAELEFHLEMRIREYMSGGMDEESARGQALRRMGDLRTLDRTCRQLARQRNRHWRWRNIASEFVQDCSFALRRAGRSRSLSLLIVLTLGLGIGVNGAVFGLIQSILLNPLPFREAEQLVRIQEETPRGAGFSVSTPNFLDFREASRTIEDMAAVFFPMSELTLLGGAEPTRLRAVPCTGNFFQVLGIQPEFGRAFTWQDSQPVSGSRGMVISHELWTRQFGRNPGVLLSDLNLDGENWTVIGILPAGFSFPVEADVWLPFPVSPPGQRDDHRMTAFGRLAAGESLQSAREELGAIAGRLGESYPDSNAGWGIRLTSFEDWQIGDQARLALWVLQASVALILLLACANVSNLLLAQVSGRTTEIGLRSALGASRFRIVRQLLTESFLLALLACLVGTALSRWGIQLLANWDPMALPRIEEADFDGSIVFFILVISLLVGFLCGVVPALHFAGGNLSTRLTGGRGQQASSSLAVRKLLVMGQVSLAVVLLIGSGLLLRSLWNLSQIDVGFDLDRLAVANLNLPPNRYPEGSAETSRFYQLLYEKLKILPGINGVGASMVDPFRGIRPSNYVGRDDAVEDRDLLPVQWRAVTPGFFRASGVEIVMGRDFDDISRPVGGDTSPLPVLINLALTRQLDLPENPIGSRLTWSRPGGLPLEVIGVVENLKDVDIQLPPAPMLFLPNSVVGWPQMTLFLRYSEGSPNLAESLSQTIREIDPSLPRPGISLLQENVRDQLSQPRLNTELMAVFGSLALFLAALGVYGILAHSVRQRRQEIGVRLALGAVPGDVRKLILAEGLRLIGIGILIGLPVSLGLLRFLRGLLYETSLLDPWTLILVPLILIAIGLLACYLPARRAARVDPLASLREA